VPRFWQAVAKRNYLPPLLEPPYNFMDVPYCKRDLSESVVIACNSRATWLNCLSELVLVCNESADRRERAHSTVSFTRGKPLALEYIADRCDTDDPIRGYMVRSKKESWMQGYITVTTFTTWQKWFVWDSEAGVPEDDPNDEDWEENEWRQARTKDDDFSIGRELQAQIHDGDPEDEGVIWPHLAEISLLGGLGCGGWLLSLILEELEAPDSQYEYCITHATENSVPFYERHGFIRIGSLARYESEEKKAAVKASAPVKRLPAWPATPAHYNSPACNTSTYCYAAKPDSTPAGIAREFGLDTYDVIFLNRHIYPELKPGSKLRRDTLLRLPTRRVGKKCALEQAAAAAAQEGGAQTRWYISQVGERERERERERAREREETPLQHSLTPLCSRPAAH
jgi:hypothetical protein